ncbi:MAG: DUF2332 domain-containing protein [Vulcanimicrobiaceae bacterium]
MELTHSVYERLLLHARTCSMMGSPLYGSMMEAAAREYERGGALRELLDEHANRSRIGLRLFGALHLRAIDGSAPALAAHLPSTGGDGDAVAAWHAALQFVEGERERVATLMERTPQTNEVARSMPLLSAFLAAAARAQLPMRIFEIGASAGLNLRWDRYCYSGSNWSWGDPSSRLHLQNRERSGAPEHLDAAVPIVERRGCDLHPLDPGDPADARELLSFVWPDQLERFRRLDAALAIARDLPVAIDAADGIEWIGRIAPQPDTLTVVMHSVITEHMPHDAREGLRAAIAALGNRAASNAPVAWVRMEQEAGGRYQTRVKLWPYDDDLSIASSDGHAQDIEWVATA